MSEPSLFEKFSTQAKGVLHDLADKMEDPGRTAKQLVRDIDQAIGQAEEQMVDVRAQFNLLQSKRDAAQAKVEQHAVYAKKAVDKGDDELAREALAEKKKHASAVVTYEQQIAAFKPSLDNLEAEISKLHRRKDEMAQKTNLLEARAATAAATNKAASIIGGIGSQASASERFDKLEEKVAHQEAEARARSGMAASRNGDALKEKFAALDNSSTEIDDELAALKAAKKD